MEFLKLPPYLSESIQSFKIALEKIQNHEKYFHFDCDYCDLQNEINNAEVNEDITLEEANFLRNKYLYENS